jgi:hypothetical protein
MRTQTETRETFPLYPANKKHYGRPANLTAQTRLAAFAPRQLLSKQVEEAAILVAPFFYAAQYRSSRWVGEKVFGGCERPADLTLSQVPSVFVWAAIASG